MKQTHIVSFKNASLPHSQINQNLDHLTLPLGYFVQSTESQCCFDRIWLDGETRVRQSVGGGGV
jgi:hypothetical protein